MITILGKYFMMVTFQLITLGLQSLVLTIPVYYLFTWNLKDLFLIDANILQIYSIIFITRIILKFDIKKFQISTAQLSDEQLEKLLKNNE